MRKSQPTLLLLSMLAGCGGNGSGSVHLTVDSAGPINNIDALQVRISLSGNPLPSSIFALPDAPSTIPPARSLTLAPLGASSGPVVITVDAVDRSGAKLASGTASGLFDANGATAISVTLGGAPALDASIDGPMGDLAILNADLAMVDMAVLDAAVAEFTVVDSAAPDLVTTPDLAELDLAVPDLITLDLAIVDLAMPDFSVTDLSMPDLTTPDFSKPPDSSIAPPADQAMPPPPDMAIPPDLTVPPDLGPVCKNDGIKNGSETDIDCGGGCKVCAPYKACKVDGDCDASLGAACTFGTCGLGVALIVTPSVVAAWRLLA